MFEFWQGGNIYVPTTDQGTVGGNVTIPLPGGGSVNVGGSYGTNQPQQGTCMGNNCTGGFPPPYVAPVNQGGMGGLNGLLNNPMLIILIIVGLVLATRK